MKNLIRATILAGLLLACGSVLAAQISIGVTIGEPPPPRVVRVVPVSPGPEFIWVEGYWYPAGGRYRWHQGYWTRPPYDGYRWVAPRYDGGRYFAGYWDGGRGRIEHDHHWDRGRRKDFDRGRHRGERERGKRKDHDRGRDDH